MKKVVKVHCGSAYVKGAARKYRYLIAQVFEPKKRKRDGIVTYRATGIIVGPFRSEAKAIREGKVLATVNQAVFVYGYGSLHGKPTQQSPWDLIQL